MNETFNLFIKNGADEFTTIITNKIEINSNYLRAIITNKTTVNSNLPSEFVNL